MGLGTDPLLRPPNSHDSKPAYCLASPEMLGWAPITLMEVAPLLGLYLRPDSEDASYFLWWCFREHENDGDVLSAPQVLCGGDGSLEKQPLPSLTSGRKEEVPGSKPSGDLQGFPWGIHTSNTPISSILSGKSRWPLPGGGVTSDRHPHLGFPHSTCVCMQPPRDARRLWILDPVVWRTQPSQVGANLPTARVAGLRTSPG